MPDAEEGDRHHDERPELLPEAGKQPGERDTDVDEQQGQDQLGGVDIGGTAALAQAQRVAPGKDGGGQRRGGQTGQREGDGKER